MLGGRDSAGSSAHNNASTRIEINNIFGASDLSTAQLIIRTVALKIFRVAAHYHPLPITCNCSALSYCFTFVEISPPYPAWIRSGSRRLVLPQPLLLRLEQPLFSTRPDAATCPRLRGLCWSSLRFRRPGQGRFTCPQQQRLILTHIHLYSYARFVCFIIIRLGARLGCSVFLRGLSPQRTDNLGCNSLKFTRIFSSVHENA